MGKRVLITGATGTVGKVLVQLCEEQGVSYVGTSRDDKKVCENTVWFDFENNDTFEAALTDVRTVFLMRPPHLSKATTFIPFLEKVKEKGIESVVFLSLMGAEENKVVPHRKIEELIKEMDIPYTFLRPSFFMQNLEVQYREDIKERGEIPVPAGKGRTSFIDVRDIAEVAMLILKEPRDHIRKAYTLTGKESLTYEDVAQLFSNTLLTKVAYTNPSLWRYYRMMKSKGNENTFIMVTLAIYTLAKLGKAAGITDDLYHLLGREPRTMENYIQDFAHLFQ